jgi:hypothetical protein
MRDEVEMNYKEASHTLKKNISTDQYFHFIPILHHVGLLEPDSQTICHLGTPPLNVLASLRIL